MVTNPDVEIYNASAYVNLTSATLELRDPSGTLVHTQQWARKLITFRSYSCNYKLFSDHTRNLDSEGSIT